MAVGPSIERRDARPRMRGHTKHATEVTLPNMAHAALVRST